MWKLPTRAPHSERLPYRELLGAGDVPFGINVAISTSAALAAAVVGALIPTGDPGWRVVPMCIALAAAGWATVDLAAGAIGAVVGFLLVNGFLINRLGNLSWHGSADAYRLAAVAACVGLGWAAGVARRLIRNRRSWQLESLLEHPDDPMTWSDGVDDKSYLEVEGG